MSLEHCHQWWVSLRPSLYGNKFILYELSTIHAKGKVIDHPVFACIGRSACDLVLTHGGFFLGLYFGFCLVFFVCLLLCLGGSHDGRTGNIGETLLASVKDMGSGILRDIMISRFRCSNMHPSLPLHGSHPWEGLEMAVLAHGEASCRESCFS